MPRASEAGDSEASRTLSDAGGPKGWAACLVSRDARAIYVVGGCMLAWLAALGYPLLDWDTSRYMSVVYLPFRRPDTAPTLQYWVFWPFWGLLGPWTIPLLCNALLLYTMGVASRIVLGRVSAPVLLAAFVLSGMHLWANFILVDSYFAIGVVAAFCLASGVHRIPMLLILVYACVAHSANFFSLAPIAIVALAWRREWRSLAGFTVTFVAVVLAISAGAYHLFGHFTPLSIHGSSNLVGRVMADFPDTVEEYAAANPGSAFARKKGVFLAQVNAWKQRPDIQARVPAWFPMEPYRWPFVQAFNAINVCFRGSFPLTHWPKEGFGKQEQSAYVRHVFLTRPVEFCVKSVENVFLFVIAAAVQGADDWPYNYAYAKSRDPYKELVAPYSAGWEGGFQRSLQMRAKDDLALRTALFPVRGFGVLFALFLALGAATMLWNLSRRRGLAQPDVFFAALALIACLAQSCVMANLSSMHPRYYTTLYFIIAFSSLLALARARGRAREGQGRP
jgi:hypothetical protein